MGIHVVLVHPEIHWNTGNAGRTCLAAGATLHLVKPLGFSLDEREVKRAGLDYWEHVNPRVWAGWDAFERELPSLGEPYFFSTKATRLLWDAPLGDAEDTTLFYAGDAVIELYRTETPNYRNNLASSAPSLWVIMRPDASRNGYRLLAVTADPAEGEALTDAGNDLVEPVAMPVVVAEVINHFIAKHHVERPFYKRRRERAASLALGCRGDEERTEDERA